MHSSFADEEDGGALPAEARPERVEQRLASATGDFAVDSGEMNTPAHAR
jgi:hypothetical protein